MSWLKPTTEAPQRGQPNEVRASGEEGSASKYFEETYHRQTTEAPQRGQPNEVRASGEEGVSVVLGISDDKPRSIYNIIKDKYESDL